MDEILQREDVKTLISEIKNNEKYFNTLIQRRGNP